MVDSVVFLFAVTALLLVVLPVSVFLCVRLATWAYLKTRHKFKQTHKPCNPREED